MKDQKTGKNPYATRQGGKIDAPHARKNPPKSVKRTGTDLRVKK